MITLALLSLPIQQFRKSIGGIRAWRSHPMAGGNAGLPVHTMDNREGLYSRQRYIVVRSGLSRGVKVAVR